MKLDLGSLKSVRAFAETFLKSESRLDVLINNAGKPSFNTFKIGGTKGKSLATYLNIRGNMALQLKAFSVQVWLQMV